MARPGPWERGLLDLEELEELTPFQVPRSIQEAVNERKEEQQAWDEAAPADQDEGLEGDM